MTRFVIMLLLGEISPIQLEFIEGNFDDNDYIMKHLTQQKAIEHKYIQNANHEKVGVRAQSDPIFGSLGAEAIEKEAWTKEQKEEQYLRSLKPASTELDSDEHPATQDSLAWAEKSLGTKLEIPKTDQKQMTEEEHQQIFEYSDDEDVTTTLQSAHQAELIHGYHQVHTYGYGYGYGGYNNTAGDDKNSTDIYNYVRPKVGLNGIEEHKTQQYTPSWGGNSTHDAYNREYGTPPEEKYGYSGYYYGDDNTPKGYYNNSESTNKPSDWWNHLVKDKYNGNGMTSAKIATKLEDLDPTDNDYQKKVDAALANQAKEAKKKMSAGDKEAAKELKEDLDESKKGAAGNLPPELAGSLAQKKAIPSKVTNLNQKDEIKFNMMVIDGQKIAIPDDSDSAMNPELLDKDI